MEIVVDRTYLPKGTNGALYIDDKYICDSIERPWLNNRNQVSCIPEGKYPVTIYNSPKHGKVLLVNKVPSRSMIEIHASNAAIPELLGCLSPVTELTGAGTGSESRKALAKVNALAFKAIESGQPVWLIVTSLKGYPKS